MSCLPFLDPDPEGPKRPKADNYRATVTDKTIRTTKSKCFESSSLHYIERGQRQTVSRAQIIMSEFLPKFQNHQQDKSHLTVACQLSPISYCLSPTASANLLAEENRIY